VPAAWRSGATSLRADRVLSACLARCFAFWDRAAVALKRLNGGSLPHCRRPQPCRLLAWAGYVEFEK